MIQVKKEGVILNQANVDFESEAVLNPATIRQGDTVHMLYRAVRKGNFSTIGCAKLQGPLTVAGRWDVPFLSPDADYEKQGMEDPRIVQIDGVYYLAYIAFDGKDALGALATSTDLESFEKHGIIVPHFKYAEFNELVKDTSVSAQYQNTDAAMADVIVMDKDLVFFPRRVNGKLTFMHRIKPDIQLTAVGSLDELTPEFWRGYLQQIDKHIMLAPKHPHERSYVGGGCPPVETEQGWVVIYHGVKNTDKGFVYSACAALFDLDNPLKEIARLPYALFSPELDYELSGDVNNVCFPTGTTVFDDILYIYYGAGDDKIACASINLLALVTELLLYADEKSA
jgi:predicted GH43/DUF377 family glycosyl hydrolase